MTRTVNNPVPGQYASRDRIDFLIACYNQAYQEMFERVKRRDQWLKVHLLGQATLLAIAVGIGFGGAGGAEPYPVVLLLTTPLAAILAGLYVTEDRLTSLAVTDIRRLTYLEASFARRDSMPEPIQGSDLEDRWNRYYQVGPSPKPSRLRRWGA